MKPAADDTPSFDFDAEPTLVKPVIWREVPQARFLSWSREMQFAYCAARDRDSVTSAHLRGENPEFYLKRAEAYGQL